MARIRIIVNPQAGRGRAARLEPTIRRHLRALGADTEVVCTTRPGEAIDLARRAKEQGFDTVVAVGGDGTSHEVVNGLLAYANGEVVGTLACIPAGSGNDFALLNGVPEDVGAACRLAAGGPERLIDVGEVTIDGHIHRYFLNVVGIGFDALVAKEALCHPRLRGLALYLPAVLKTIALTLRAARLTITVDDQEVIETKALLAVVANGPREGGGFLVAPQARTDDGWLDLTLAGEMSRLQMLALVPRFLRGTHVGSPHIVTRRARRIVITSDDPLYVHVDGEILCDHAHELSLRLLPGRLRLKAASGEFLAVRNDSWSLDAGH